MAAVFIRKDLVSIRNIALVLGTHYNNVGEWFHRMFNLRLYYFFKCFYCLLSIIYNHINISQDVSFENLFENLCYYKLSIVYNHILQLYHNYIQLYDYECIGEGKSTSRAVPHKTVR